MNGLKKSMTPRQRCAVAYPIANTAITPHVRHHRRNGTIDSILTFDVSEISKLEDADDETVARAVDGWFAVWHARVSMNPYRHLKTWPKPTISRAKTIMLGLMKRVGIEEGIEIHNGSDLHSVHVYKWATHAEIRLAMESTGAKFAEMKTAIEKEESA